MKPFHTPSTLYNTTIVFECEGQYVRKGSSPLLGVFGEVLVRCNEDGVWDFGTLRCEGKKFDIIYFSTRKFPMKAE